MKRRRGLNYRQHFEGLSKSLLRKETVTHEEVIRLLEDAKADGTERDIYETAYSRLVRIANERLKNRGKKYW